MRNSENIRYFLYEKLVISNQLDNRSRDFVHISNVTESLTASN